MIRIPDEVAIQIEKDADATFEEFRVHLPLNDTMWKTLQQQKEGILSDFAANADLEMIPELLEVVIPLCVRLGVIRRIELMQSGETPPGPLL